MSNKGDRKYWFWLVRSFSEIHWLVTCSLLSKNEVFYLIKKTLYSALNRIKFELSLSIKHTHTPSLTQLTLSLCPLFQLKERWENLLFLSMTKSKFFSEGQLNENYFDPFKTIKSRWSWFKMFLSKRLSEVMIEAFNIFNALKEFNIKFRRRYDHIVTPRSNLFH